MTHIIFWADEPSRTREVRGACTVCARWLEREYGEHLDVRHPPIVSAAGLAHCEGDGGTGDTACGKDATGDDWWWSEG